MRLSMKPSMNWFFVFVPVAVLLEHVEGIPVPLIFFSAALAILPIASMIVRATEQIASRVGDTIGGLLNATFGNAPELIITLVALKAGLFDMVRASLAGAIMANLLLALGIAFFLGGIRYHEQEYNPVASRVIRHHDADCCDKPEHTERFSSCSWRRRADGLRADS